MSHAFDETYEVYNERTRKARKPHECEACEQVIPPGARYSRVFAVFDGSALVWIRCARCQALHEHLRTLAPGDMWPEERLDCGQDYVDEWGELPDDVARLAFVLPGEDPGAPFSPVAPAPASTPAPAEEP